MADGAQLEKMAPENDSRYVAGRDGTKARRAENTSFTYCKFTAVLYDVTMTFTVLQSPRLSLTGGV